MILGIFLALGDSFKNMAKTGQDVQFKKFYLKAFSKKFSKIYIFTYSDEKVKGLPSNVQIIPNNYSLNRFIYGLISPFLNFKFIKECDVFRSYHLSGTVPAIVTRLFFSKPYVFNYAYNYFHFAIVENKKFQYCLFRLLEPLALITAAKIFAANKSILKKLDQTKALYLPNGVDTNFFKPHNKKNISHKILVLSVGRLEKQKNFESLVQALAKVKADLLLVGKGSLKSRLISLSRKFDIHLKIIEKVNYHKMPQIYNRADIFVLPSIAEGHPKALLEAMACSLPVIGSRIQGVTDIIKNNENGLLVENSKKNLNQAIIRLTKDKNLREKLGKNARLFIYNHYDLSKLLHLEINSIKYINQ